MGGRASRPSPIPNRADPLLDPHSDHRGHRAPGRPASRHRRLVLWAAEQWMVVGTGRSHSGPSTIAPQAFDLNVPANRAKLEAVRALSELTADAGLPLTHLATAFVICHPAVTSVIIGPRHPSSLMTLLAGANVALSGGLLDRIDEIVPPGSELNP